MNHETMSRAPQEPVGSIDGVLLALRNAGAKHRPALAGATRRAWPYAKPLAWAVAGVAYLAVAFAAAVWIVF